MTQTKARPLRAAIIGMGGFARQHHAALRELEARGEVRVAATCDLNPDQFPELRDDLRARGTQIHRDFDALLDAHPDLDFAAIATPIPLHAPMHRACARRGIAVYLEKPPTLDWRELDAMIETDKGARFASQVGFNFIGEDARQALKRRLAEGEFGRLQIASFSGCWPRPESYYERAPWAGRLRLGQSLVLDSCAGNAFAHYVHNLLFWCGQNAVDAWGDIEEVEAELYRAHAIESFDTVFARGLCSGVELRVGATHASQGANWQREWLQCERATLTYVPRGGTFEIIWHDGPQRGTRESGPTDAGSSTHWLERNIAIYADYLRGERARPLNTLSDSRPFVVFNDLLFVAAGRIHTVESSHVQIATGADGTRFRVIENVEAELGNFARTGDLPSQSGAAWGRSGGRATPDDLPRLDATVDAMLAGMGAG